MRISDMQRQEIKKYAGIIFGASAKVYLFGSRADDTKRGGDIDLFIDCDQEYNSFTHKVDFLAKLYGTFGEQKIDVVIKQKNDTRLVTQEALTKGILL